MQKNNFGGLLIAVDGANGVGKTTLIGHICNALRNFDIEVFPTQEPTNTARGEFVRQIAETNGGEGLACLVAADRYFHLEDEIIPMLKKNKIVISDRYVFSSLLFQRMDDVNTDFILKINEQTICPDIQIVVTADENTIKERLDKRSKQANRFETEDKVSTEIAFLNEGLKVFKKLGIHVVIIENIADVGLTAMAAAKYILEVLGK
jgi:dTMP kinase